MPQVKWSSAEIMGAIESLRGLILSGQQQESKMATNIETLNQKVDDLKSDVVAGRVSIDKAVAAFNGVSAQYKAAKDQLEELIKNNGTPEQYQALFTKMDDANTEMDKQRADLDAVVDQTTPANPA